MLTNPYLTALGIPIGLIIVTAFIRKLVRGSEWSKADFFLGVELSLSALTLAVVNFIDISRASAKSSANMSPSIVISNGLFVAIIVVALLFVVSQHQDWEKKTQQPKMQVFWLGIVCNTLGAALFIAFIVLVKGVD